MQDMSQACEQNCGEEQTICKRLPSMIYREARLTGTPCHSQEKERGKGKQHQDSTYTSQRTTLKATSVAERLTECSATKTQGLAMDKVITEKI